MRSIAGITAASILLVASQTAFAQAAPEGQTQPPPSASGPGAMPTPGPMGPPGGGMMVPGQMGQPGGSMPPGPDARAMPGPTGQRVSGMTMDPAMMQEHMKRMEEHAANMEALLRQLVELQQKK
jgi:hypothetical protein